MSIALPLVDLSSASIGTTGKVFFDVVGIGAGGVSANPSVLGKPPHVRIYNDSRFSVLINFITEGDSDHLTPGAWRTYTIQGGENGFQWTIENAMNITPPISQLSATYYFPGENIDETGTLGNSPIGGSVATSSVQTLSNEGGARNTLVIDIGDLAISQLWQIFTDHFKIFVDQSGVAHQVLNTQTSGNPLQIGQAGDISEVLGKLTVDQVATFVGNILANGGINTNTIRDDVNGNTAIDLSAGTGVATFPLAISITIASPVVVNGSTSGTATFYQFFAGTFKLGVLILNNFRNGGASNQILTFPTAFTTAARLYTGDFPAAQLRHNAAALTVGVITSLAVGGGSITTATVFGAYSLIDFASACEDISFNSGQVSAHTGISFILGI